LLNGSSFSAAEPGVAAGLDHGTSVAAASLRFGPSASTCFCLFKKVADAVTTQPPLHPSVLQIVDAAPLVDNIARPLPTHVMIDRPIRLHCPSSRSTHCYFPPAGPANDMN
jgi:hypothetical protein